MRTTNGILSSAFFFCLILANPVLCRADSSRDEIIQKQLDCVSRNLNSTAINWQDVCVMTDNSAQNQNEDTQAGNQQANPFEDTQGQGSADGVEHQFSSNGQPATPKESPNAMPESTSDSSMLKDILTPDLFKNPKVSSNVETRVNTLDTGAEIFYYRYSEPRVILNPGNYIARLKESGPMYGAFADYAYRPADPNFFNNFLTNVYMLQARYASSRDLVFDGGEGKVKNKHDEATEFRGLIGKDYYVGSNVRLTPYFGFGYRYLLDLGDGQITNRNIIQEDEKSHYYYIPLGMDTTFELPDRWEVNFNAEYDFLIQGIQKSYFSDWDQFGAGNQPNLAFRQDTGFGVRASFRFLKRGPILDFYVEPYVRFWDIDNSKQEAIYIDGTASQVSRPANSTTEVGTKFGVQF